MPYSSAKEVPDSVPEDKRDKFKEVFNSVYADTKDEGKAMAAAWSEVKKSILKMQLDTDVFSLKETAEARSRDMGLGGAVHAVEVNGQAYFVPGESSEEYLAFVEGSVPEPRMSPAEALREVVAEIMNKRENTEIDGTIIKADDEQRIVWGWASVISKDGKAVVDRQGDVITPDVLVKAANEFMLDVRMAKAMHSGDRVGEVIHSLPLTKELTEALGIQSDKEGWIIAMKIHSDEVWEGVKSGLYKAFSIGGKAIRTAMNE